VSDKIFVHYPPCAGVTHEDAWDAIIRAHATLGVYRERVEIFSTPRVVPQVQKIEEIRNTYNRQSYLLYALLYFLTTFRVPPTPARLRMRPLFREDRFKLHYHAREIDDCATGIFVPRADGKWPYDMWRNARRLMRQGKPVWQIQGNKADGWRILPLGEMPKRNERLDRKATMHDIGLYTEKKVYPSLFTLIRDALRNRS
jgi:hypothetical protein